MQSRSSEARGKLDKWCNNNASQRNYAIMLQNYEKGILAASGEIAIFNNVELSGQSKRPHAVGKQAVLLYHVVIGIDRFFVFFVPLARSLLALGGVKLRQVTP